jgi:DNA mismatch endonuclease (patch repair protein)
VSTGESPRGGAVHAPPASSPGRRRNMQAIRRTGTKPEVALRSALHRAGLRFRKDHRLDLPGGRVRPDVVFTRVRVAVFVDGCFWHTCPEHGLQPTQNTSYWGPKLERTVERDRRNTAVLRAAGWTVLRIWEHETVDAATTRVAGAVRSPSASVRPVHCHGSRNHCN